MLRWFTLQDIQVYCGGALHLESIRHGGAKIWTRMAILSAIFVSHQQDLSCSRFHEDTSSIVHMDSTVCFLCLLNFDLYIYMCMHMESPSSLLIRMANAKQARVTWAWLRPHQPELGQVCGTIPRHRLQHLAHAELRWTIVGIKGLHVDWPDPSIRCLCFSCSWCIYIYICIIYHKYIYVIFINFPTKNARSTLDVIFCICCKLIQPIRVSLVESTLKYIFEV